MKVHTISLSSYLQELQGLEPGRYFVASAFSLVANVTGIRTDYPEYCHHEEFTGTRKKQKVYYINDGVFGSFNCVLSDPAQASQLKAIAVTEEGHRTKAQFVSTIRGPTQSSIDIVLKDVNLPELTVGDWLMFNDMGAYTMSLATNYCGMQGTKMYYVISEKDAFLFSHIITKIFKLPCQNMDPGPNWYLKG